MGVALVMSFVAGCKAPPVDTSEAVLLPETLRQLPAGDIVGSAGSQGGYAWLGIPYATPPLGPLRWHAPSRLPRWTGIREANRVGHVCPQMADLVSGVPGAPLGSLVGDEDCLVLNVYSPALDRDVVDQKLPVFFFIHWGGHSVGSASFFDGSSLAAAGAIVVTVNYRLGVLGWFRHAALRLDATPSEASGNYGTLDLIEALRWVQDNVAGFGGDPGNVTLIGVSAGGQNVYSLLAAPAARGLFHRAIVHSAWASTASPAEAENLADASEPGHFNSSNEIIATLLIKNGLARDRGEALRRLSSTPDAEMARFLRSLTVQQIFAALVSGKVGMYEFPRLFSDGVVLPTGPLIDGIVNSGPSVPVLLGSTKDEEKVFLLLNRHLVFWALDRWPLYVYDERRYFREAEYWTQIRKVASVDESVRALMKANAGRVFVYRFDWDEEPTILWINLAKLLGAFHGLDLMFLFHSWNLSPREAQYVFTEKNRLGREGLSAAIRSYWIAFAKNGEPGTGLDGKLPRWEPSSPGLPVRAMLDTAEGGSIRMASYQEERFDEIFASILKDGRFADEDDRCRTLRDVAEVKRLVRRESDLMEAADEQCGPRTGLGFRGVAR